MKKKPDFEVKQRIDDYYLENFLGGGQDGEVWRCKKISTFGKDFAMKMLNSIEQEEKQERFNREIHILAEINHPNIITIFAQGEAFNPVIRKNVPFYVMEFLDAAPLDAALKKISQKEIFYTACILFQQMTSALNYIHEMEITHGDIKPSNIMVNLKNKIAKLTDFGFGLLPGETETSREEYPDSSYHAPKDLSPKESDIYKLGRTFQDCINIIELNLNSDERTFLNGIASILLTKPQKIFLTQITSELDFLVHYQKQNDIKLAFANANKKLNLLTIVTRHDIMNSLTILGGYLELLNDHPPEPKHSMILAKLKSSVKMITASIEFTQRYQDLGVVAPDWMNVNDTFYRACIHIDIKKIRYESTVDRLEIFADSLLGQVFYNILQNAVEHGDHVSVVRLSSVQVPDGMLLRIEDDGIGIPDNDKEKIFNRGFGKNNGMGLFLSREILLLTGISIRETGSEGSGARFDIFVPKKAYRFTQPYMIKNDELFDTSVTDS